MKSKYVCLLTTMMLLVAGGQQAFAAMETFTTGKDWAERMSPREKIMAVVAPAMLLHQHGIPVQRPISEYIPTMDRVVLNNPYLKNEDAANIFVSTVYAYEPESRRALDALEIELRHRKIYKNAYSLNPRLLVSLASDEDH